MDRITPKKKNIYTNEKTNNNSTSENKKINFNIEDIIKSDETNKFNSKIKEKAKIEIEDTHEEEFFQYNNVNDEDENDIENDFENDIKNDFKNENKNEDQIKVNINKSKLDMFNKEQDVNNKILDENKFKNDSSTLISSILNDENSNKNTHNNVYRNEVNLVKISKNLLLFSENRIDFCHTLFPIGAKIDLNSICSEILMYLHVEKYNSLKTLFSSNQYEQHKRCAFISDNILYLCKLNDVNIDEIENNYRCNTEIQEIQYLEIISKYETNNIYRILEYVSI